MGTQRALGQVSTWAELGAKIQSVAHDSAVSLHAAGRRGLRDSCEGPPSAQASLRTFGVAASNIRVVLYRDNHAWCPYCHKVWMQLEEKRVPYRVEKVSMNCYGSKSRAFLAKTPRGLLPALELDGRFYTESSVIMQLIEDAFPERPLLPAEGPHKVTAKRLLSIERELFGAWLHWLRGEESVSARRTFEHAMDTTEEELMHGGGPYFLGAQVSLVDCVFASSLERIAASILYYKGLRVKGGRWPHINAWFGAMECLESYRASQSDFHTHVHDLPPQIGGCLASGTPEQQVAMAAIDGTDGSWQLPLTPLSVDSLEPGNESPLGDRIEAANALVHCNAGVIKSSLAGANCSEHVSQDVDAAFRYAVLMLLNGLDDLQHSPDTSQLSKLNPQAAAALRYTRDRICVPRDMSFPAARQLRGHLNFVADAIDPRVGDQWLGVPLTTHDRRDSDPVMFSGL